MTNEEHAKRNRLFGEIKIPYELTIIYNIKKQENRKYLIKSNFWNMTS